MSGRTLLALMIVWVGCLPSESLTSYSEGAAPASTGGYPGATSEPAPVVMGAASQEPAVEAARGDAPAQPTGLDPGRTDSSGSAPANAAATAATSDSSGASGSAGAADDTAGTPASATAGAAGAAEGPESAPDAQAPVAVAGSSDAAVVAGRPGVATGVRFVRLVADSAVQSPYTSIAEFNVLDAAGQVIDRSGWVASADSEELVYVGGARAGFAIDGLPSTLWHTAWFGVNPPPDHPHTFEVDMRAPHDVGGFRYLGRQDASLDGRIAAYRFFVSADGVEWGEPVASGTLENTTAEQEVRLR